MTYTISDIPNVLSTTTDENKGNMFVKEFKVWMTKHMTQLKLPVELSDALTRREALVNLEDLVKSY